MLVLKHHTFFEQSSLVNFSTCWPFLLFLFQIVIKAKKMKELQERGKKKREEILIKMRTSRRKGRVECHHDKKASKKYVASS